MKCFTLDKHFITFNYIDKVENCKGIDIIFLSYIEVFASYMNNIENELFYLFIVKVKHQKNIEANLYQ